MGKIILPAGSDNTLQAAAAAVLRGGIIAYPTETIYGLGARYDDEQALQRLYELKNRPSGKAIPLIIGDASDLEFLAEYVTNSAKRLISRFWPGPLTLIFRAKAGLSSFITCNSTIALRMPGDSFALRLVREAGLPITATSANISGMPPALSAEMAAGYFGAGLDLIVDGGKCRDNQPSTIVDVTAPDFRILREGSIRIQDLPVS